MQWINQKIYNSLLAQEYSEEKGRTSGEGERLKIMGVRNSGALIMFRKDRV